MTPKEYADTLVNKFKIILMSEDTDCGNEILCTTIAIKNSLIVVKEIINEVIELDRIRYWKEVERELNKL